MKLTLAEINRELKEVSEAILGLENARFHLEQERTHLLKQSKRNPVTISVTKAMNGHAT